MANDFTFKDGGGTTRTAKAADNAGVHLPATYLADSAGAEITGIGKTGDAAVITDANGSISAKLRGLVKWAFERMPASLGQKTKSNSFPVVLASNDERLPSSLGQAVMADSFAVVLSSDHAQIDTGLKANYVEIATADAITDTASHDYKLSDFIGAAVIRQYREFRISIRSTHNQTLQVRLYSALPALNSTSVYGEALLYDESAIVPATAGRLILAASAGGTAASSALKAVPALAGVHSNLTVRIDATLAPASGNVTITVEMH